MSYDNNIPEFALRPAKDPEGEFDPTPYDRLLYGDENDNTAGEIEAVEEKKPIRVVPLGEISRYDKTSIRDMEEKPPAKVFIEADIIVPDSKPDLMKVISMSGKIRTEKRHIEGGTSGTEKISCTGEIDIETLYLPEKPEKDRPLILIKNTVPFDNRWNEPLEAGTEALLHPHIEKIEYTVLNERKLRIRAAAAVDVKKYRDVSLKILREVEGEKIEMLKEQVSFMDIVQRRQDSMEIEDAFEIKDENIRPVEILKSSIMVSPVSSQISGSKAVVGGNICCSIMYLAETSEEGEKKIIPAYFRGETGFTQFIPLERGDEASESRILFTDHSLKADISDEEDKPAFRLKGSVVTEVQIYSQVEKSVVKDIYHSEKDMDFDTSEVYVKSYAGAAGKEFSIKGTAAVNDEAIDKPLFAEGTISGVAATGNNDFVQISGKADVKVIALSEKGEIVSGSAKLPFEIPVEIKKMKNFTPAKAEVTVRDISFEKTGDREIEVTLYLTASAFTEKNEEITVLNNLCYIEDENKKRQPPMALYLAGADDTLWSIAKKFRTSEENIREINGIEKEVKEGERILVVR